MNMLDLFSPSIIMSRGFPFPWKVMFFVKVMSLILYVPFSRIILSLFLELLMTMYRSFSGFTDCWALMFSIWLPFEVKSALFSWMVLLSISYALAEATLMKITIIDIAIINLIIFEVIFPPPLYLNNVIL